MPSSTFDLLTRGTRVRPDDAAPKRQRLELDKPAKSERARVVVPDGAVTAPPALEGFSDVPIPDAVLNNVEYAQPTQVQALVIPLLLQQRSALVCAPTGSGKTLAYLLPILSALYTASETSTPSVLIVVPTKELVQQTLAEARTLAAGTGLRVGAADRKPRRGGANVVEIGTPGAVMACLETDASRYAHVTTLVADEADKLLDEALREQTELALSRLPVGRQNVFLSATLPSHVQQFAESITLELVRVSIGRAESVSRDVDQKLLYCGSEDGKRMALRQIIANGEINPPTLIFVQSIERANELMNELRYDKLNCDVIHSGRDAAHRAQVISRMRQGLVWVLICTEVLGRGIDFKGVNLVINYDFPQSVASYIHRVGRTGRAGRRGRAVTFFTKQDAPYVKSVASVMRSSGCDVPEWMLALAPPSKQQKQQLRTRPPRRKPIASTSKYDKQQALRRREMIAASKRRKMLEQSKEAFQVGLSPTAEASD